MHILSVAVGLGIGFLLGYLTAYFAKKGQNKAEIEDVGIITDEKQKVITNYELKIEEIKKQHTLDIEKRKYKYEEKSKQYRQFFSFLDEFNGKATELIETKMMPLVNTFFANYVISRTDGQNENAKQAISEYMSGMQNILSQLNNNYNKIKLETNALKLIASDKICLLLSNLDYEIKVSQNLSMEIINKLSKQENIENMDSIKPIRNELLKSGENYNEIRKQIITEMKVELNEI